MQNNIDTKTSIFPSDVWVGLLVFVFPAVIYCFYRINIYSMINGDALSLMASPSMSWLEAFGGLATSIGGHSYYRPVSVYGHGNLAELFRNNNDTYFVPVVVVVGTLIGLLSFLIYQICYFFCKSKYSSSLATLLYVFSAGSLSGSWYTIWTGFMLSGLICICGAFLAYLQFNVHTGWKKGFWLVALILFCLLGPYTREIAYVPAAVILAVEVGRLFLRRSWFIVIPVILFCHALIPKLLVSLLGIYEKPIGSWLSQGKFAIGAGFGINDFDLQSVINLIWYKMGFSTPGYIINEFPPVLWVCVIAALVVGSIKVPPTQLFKKSYWRSTLDFRPVGLKEFSSDSVVWVLLRAGSALLIGTILVATFLPLFKIEMDTSLRNHMLQGFLFLFLILSAIRFGPVLPLWFAVTYPVNVMTGMNLEAHLVFVVPPLAILCALYINDLVVYVKRIRLGYLRTMCMNVILVACIIIVLDHVGNVQTSFMALNNINTGHQQIAQWILKNVPKGSIIIPDSSPSQEIAYRMDSPYKNFRYKKMVNSEGGIVSVSNLPPHDHFWVWNEPTYSDMRILVDEAIKQNRDIYYLHVSTKSTDNRQLVPTDHVKKVASFQVNNLGFEQDPLRSLVDTRYFSRSFVVNEWDNAYAHLGQGETRYVWRTQWEIYKLTSVPSQGFDQSLFKYLNRSDSDIEYVPVRETSD